MTTPKMDGGNRPRKVCPRCGRSVFVYYQPDGSYRTALHSDRARCLDRCPGSQKRFLKSYVPTAN